MNNFTTKREHNHFYLFYKGKLIYKRWLDKKGNKTEPSIIIDKKGFPLFK